jgi:hypothetical protein
MPCVESLTQDKPCVCVCVCLDFPPAYEYGGQKGHDNKRKNEEEIYI